MSELDVVDRRVREILYSAIARAYGVPTVPDDHQEDDATRMPAPPPTPDTGRPDVGGPIPW